jgi:hypothetical protein
VYSIMSDTPKVAQKFGKCRPRGGSRMDLACGAPVRHLTLTRGDEHVLVNTEPQRQRAGNVARDPRITVLIHGENPYYWAAVRGHVTETVTGDEARRHIDELSCKYTGQDYARPSGRRAR